jgi:hypothetical protein
MIIRPLRLGHHQLALPEKACSPSAITTRLAVFLDRDVTGGGAGE